MSQPKEENVALMRTSNPALNRSSFQVENKCSTI